MTTFAPGMQLAGRFELVRRLGSGGLAEVFLARDQMSGQEVALKALHAHLAENPELSARFRREMAVTRGLDHPGIVRVFDLHEHEGRPFFSMEALRGCTLAERLRDGPLPTEEASRIARRICEALRAAHRAGVVHRDLKPQNVFLGEDGAVKLLDFGLARVAGQARLTVHSAVMGTPGYIAPELLSGAEADARADIYSLGATLFEMLTGHHAFPGSDPYEVLRRQREGAPATPGADPACALVVRRSLEADVERRFLDADQVLRALGGEHVPAPPEPQPGLSAGQFDVMVQHEGFGEGKRLRAIASKLGVALPTRGWRARLALDGKNRLAAAASRDTAEVVAALCRDEGLPATVVPARRRFRAIEWLARHCRRIGGPLSAVLPTLVVGMMMAMNKGSAAALTKGLFEAQTFPILFLLWAIVYLPVAGVLSLGAAPPLKDLPRGDPALRRLAQGIARRVGRLLQRAETLPAAQKMILDDLLREAAQTQSLAVTLAENAQSAAPSSPEAQTLPQGASRDRLAGRLLEIAAALDDALEVAALPSPDAQAASGALSRLRAEIEFARQALPAVEAVRRGENVELGAVARRRTS